MRKVHLEIAGHIVEVESDATEDTMEDLAARALGLIEETRVAASQIRFGFGITSVGSSFERPFTFDVAPPAVEPA
jgi:hypothetical protein